MKFDTLVGERLREMFSGYQVREGYTTDTGEYADYLVGDALLNLAVRVKDDGIHDGSNGPTSGLPTMIGNDAFVPVLVIPTNRYNDLVTAADEQYYDHIVELAP